MKPLDYFFDTPAEGPGHFPQRFCAFFLGLIKVLFGLVFRYKAYDAEYVQKSQTYILAANHRCYLDPLFIMMALRPRPIRYMSKEEFFKVFGVARVAAWVGTFPVKRNAADTKAIKRSVAMLKRGELVGIFPEGTRGRGLNEQELENRPAHEGVAVVAYLAKCEVIPVRLFGAERISPPVKKLWRFPQVTARFGKPLSLTDARYEGLEKAERLNRFTKDVMRAVYALENPRVRKDKNTPENPRVRKDKGLS